MQAVVMAAGEGTRLRPLTTDMPKGMVPVAGKPILQYCFDTLLSLGVSELLVIVGYRKEDIMQHFGLTYRSVPITYIDQRTPQGLAHGLGMVDPHITDFFIMMNGDNIFNADLSHAFSRHVSQSADATLVVETVSRARARETSVLSLDAEGNPMEIVEQPDSPPSSLVTTGFYVFSPVIFHACHLVQPSSTNEYELSTAIDLLLSSNRTVELVQLDGWRVNINTPEDHAVAERRLTE